MKFDIVRAWKDETYRQSLRGEAIPANPAGEVELSSEEMESGWGGSFGGPGFGGPGGFFGLSHENFQSLSAGDCNAAVFSFTHISGVTTLSPITPICINDQD